MEAVILDVDQAACLRVRQALLPVLGDAPVQYAHSLDALAPFPATGTIVIVGDGLSPEQRWKTIESLAYAARSSALIVLAFVSAETDAERTLAIRAGAHGVIGAETRSRRIFQEAAKNARQRAAQPLREQISSLPWIIERLAQLVDAPPLARGDRRAQLLVALEELSGTPQEGRTSHSDG